MATTLTNPPRLLSHSENNYVSNDGSADPFTTSTTNGHRPSSHRYSTFDTHSFAQNSSTSSPSQAKRALEAHLTETERRLQEASKLGTQLVEQRREIGERLKEVERQQGEREISAELRQKLVEIEKEYNEVGKESARAFLAPKSRLSNSHEASNGVPSSPSKFSSQAGDSPSKVSAPSRKQRNQPANRVHDIEFATEISTSLLAQVRQLQGVLVEKEEALKTVTLEKSQLEQTAEGHAQRLKGMDESEQRYKDENWNLETQTHDLIAAIREATGREQKLQQTLTTTTSEKSAAQRELDDLRQANIKLSEDYSSFQRNHDTELGSLRRDMAGGDNDRTILQKKVEELTAQNQELAKAFAMRLKSEEDTSARELGSEPEDLSLDRSDTEHSPPPSPSKMGPRHSVLETETMRTSLHHAQRMIQNLKNTIHREKTEKVELKRLLQESRDELEARRSDAGDVNGNKRLAKKSQGVLGKKAINPAALGMMRNSRTDIEHDPEWDDHHSQSSPVLGAASARPALDRNISSQAGNASDAYQTANETEGDAFETANERDNTETEAFQTGVESPGDDSSDALTETESTNKGARNSTIRNKGQSITTNAKAGDRASFISTASTSASEDEQKEIRTPVQAAAPRYRMRLSRAFRRSRNVSEEPKSSAPSSVKNSPASFMSSGVQPGQSLFAELGDLDNDSAEEGTPSKMSMRSTPNSRPGTSKQSRQNLVQSIEEPLPKLPMVDSGMMTEPWDRDISASKAAKVSTRESVIGPLPPTKSPLRSREASPQIAWDQPTQGFESIIPGFGESLLSSSKPIVNTESAVRPSRPSTSSSNRSRREAIVPPAALAGIDSPTFMNSLASEQSSIVKPSLTPSLSFSDIQATEIKPSTNVFTNISETQAHSTATRSLSDSESGSDDGREAVKGGIIGSVLGWGAGKLSTSQKKDIKEDNNETPKARSPFQEVPANIVHRSIDSQGTVKNLRSDLTPMKNKDSADQSSQTALSASEIDALLANRPKRPNSMTPSLSSQKHGSAFGPLTDIGMPSPPLRSPPLPLMETPRTPVTSSDPLAAKEAAPLRKEARRTPSQSSLRNPSATSVPPLPADHRKAIAAAQRSTAGTPTNEGLAAQTTPGLMGPPSMPASAYRNSAARGRTSSQDLHAAPTLRPGPSQQGSTSRSRWGGRASRRSSFSSFASELDERFNIRTDGMMMPQGLDTASGADPRMIRAITQTMIGEYLWKYTRKAGRGEMSGNRHRRFFWVHPYTRTLYWSDTDPSQAGRAQLKAKSVAIESVQVVNDDNPFPPGLHRKSLVVVTPGRTIKFTATTGQRHETWFNSLAYLLLRTGNGNVTSDGPGGLTAEDVAEFNPTTSRSQSRAGRSMYSQARSAYNNGSISSRPGSAGPSPMRNSSALSMSRMGGVNQRPAMSALQSPHHQANSSVASRYSQRASSVSTVGYNPTGNTESPNKGSVSSRITSGISSYFKSSKPDARASFTEAMGAAASKESLQRIRESQEGKRVAGSGAAFDSAEDVRRVLERQEREAERLENVRACCDG
ncbi:hypothetical protein MMC25_001633 [Agyrium rufum]|nr:hypothetical protein [Agyrium rufum]